MTTTFIDAALGNSATLDDIERWIASWHEEYEGDATLADYLGMTEVEYATWLEDASSLGAIIEDHRRRRIAAGA